MAVVYFDASAFVKLLVDEDGTDLAVDLWDGCDAAVSSRLAYPEVRIDGISAACFGDGEVHFGVAVRTGSSWTGIDPITLTCDSEVHTVPLSAPLERINAIRLNGSVEKGGVAVVAAVITGANSHI